jgi:hypothetical protein
MDRIRLKKLACDNTIAALLKAQNANPLNDYMVDVQDVFEDGVSELVVLDESFEKWQDWCLGGGNNTERGMLQKKSTYLKGEFFETVLYFRQIKALTISVCKAAIRELENITIGGAEKVTPETHRKLRNAIKLPMGRLVNIDTSFEDWQYWCMRELFSK